MKPADKSSVNILDLVKNMGDKPTMEELRAIQAAARTSKPATAVANRSVEQVILDNPTTMIAEFLVSYANEKHIWREPTTGSFLACRPTQLRFTYSLYPSRIRDPQNPESFGAPTEGVSVEVQGFDLETDASGVPIRDGEGNLVNKLTDAKGEKIEEPQTLMIFRIQFGIDQSRPSFGRVNNRDMLNLVPNRGVPRVHVSATANPEQVLKELMQRQPAANTGRKREQVDWSKIPEIQPAIEQVLLQHVEFNSPELEIIVSKIPVASNAPSNAVQGGAAGVANPIIAPDLGGDPFKK